MSPGFKMVTCPVCSKKVPEAQINEHLDKNCAIISPAPIPSHKKSSSLSGSTSSKKNAAAKDAPMAPIFNLSSSSRPPTASSSPFDPHSSQASGEPSKKRALDAPTPSSSSSHPPPAKRSKAAASAHLHAAAPLAERLRPRSLAEFVGQAGLVGPHALLTGMLARGAPGNIVFWGPPGCGKTTLARLIARRANAVFKELSATGVGINEVRAVFEEARGTLALTGKKTILFFDEIHRFSRSQQDIFLPFLEQGHIQLIGATTENPSFKLTGALLSRCRVFVLDRLTDNDIRQILFNAMHRVTETPLEEVPEPSDAQPSLSSSQETLLDSSPPKDVSSWKTFPVYPQATSRVVESIVSLSAGDARTALSLLELTLSAGQDTPESDLLASLRKSVSLSYDRTGESHYDMISALHKSIRGSQGSAALYWLARMLEGGEDPLFIARRLVVCSSEDIGLADNKALPLAIATYQACQFIGMPECRINLAHCVAYLAEAPKSTRSYEAYNRAEAAAKQDATLPVPLPVRNAPTKLMKDLEYGKGYCYNPEFAHPVTNDYLPGPVRDQVFLRPAGDMIGKVWDEEELRRWELVENEGEPWEGRKGGRP